MRHNWPWTDRGWVWIILSINFWALGRQWSPWYIISPWFADSGQTCRQRLIYSKSKLGNLLSKNPNIVIFKIHFLSCPAKILKINGNTRCTACLLYVAFLLAIFSNEKVYFNKRHNYLLKKRSCTVTTFECKFQRYKRVFLGMHIRWK